MVYNIMYRNSLVCSIEWNTGDVHIADFSLMPYSIFLEEGEDLDTRVNNLINFYAWCSSRLLSLDREHAKALLNSCALKQATTDKDRAEIALSYKCLSLMDSYWCTDNKSERYDSINLFHNSLGNSFVGVSLSGKPLTVTNTYLIARDLSAMGISPKAWVREGNGFTLYKGGNINAVEKELRASAILEALGIDAVRYSKSEYDGQAVTMSNCFTNDSINYVTAEEYSCNNSLQELVDKYRDEFDIGVLFEYLLGNSDMHGGNWGYLYDSNRRIIKPAPLFDFNHCFESTEDSLSQPYSLLGEVYTQKEAAETALENLHWNIESLMGKIKDKYVLSRLSIVYFSLQKDMREYANQFGIEYYVLVQQVYSMVPSIYIDNSCSKESNALMYWREYKLRRS